MASADTKEMTVKKFNAVVIGSGQSGTPLASALAQAGRKTALIERTHIGGTCINEGCTPTKTMIASGRVGHLAKRSADYGIWNIPTQSLEKGHKAYHSKEEGDWEKMNVAVDMMKVRQRKRDIVNSFRGGSEARLSKQEGLELITGDASFRDEKSLVVKMSGQEEGVVVAAEKFFINVGETPSRPDLPGLDQVDPKRVLDSTSIMELGEVPHHLIVLGGSYVGLEFAQLFRRLGSKVTVLQRGKQLVPREDPEIAEAVKQIMKEDGIDVHLDVTVANTKPDHGENVARKVVVFFELGQEHRRNLVNGSHLLLATGRTPNTESLNLSAAGVETDSKGYITVDPKLRTTSPAEIYALGDCHPGPKFTHMSYDDFRILKANHLSDSSSQTQLSTTDRQIPYVMYTDPQLGHIGLHEHEAKAKYGEDKIQTASMPMAWVARALETDESRGMMKAVVHKETEQILGFTCLGLEGGELMSIVQTAMLGSLKYTALQNAIYAHPTLAESLNNLWGYLK
ncbi:uncharacterized protein LTR77_001279 [Saxophila tyrrhenica]|uniref:Mercuric reductase n=1 Tax=Saxophila tyrrhenica TaxID=1690608 RepID=A0AAV9PPI9_9PEZI|nr:hypothetical protein LTR77_001279 [Saxophila tyrrhenica]